MKTFPSAKINLSFQGFARFSRSYGTLPHCFTSTTAPYRAFPATPTHREVFTHPTHLPWLFTHRNTHDCVREKREQAVSAPPATKATQAASQLRHRHPYLPPTASFPPQAKAPQPAGSPESPRRAGTAAEPRRPQAAPLTCAGNGHRHGATGTAAASFQIRPMAVRGAARPSGRGTLRRRKARWEL